MKENIWDQHPRICHYTKFDTVFKIIDSRELWATHFSHLNDSSEFFYSINLISKLLIDILRYRKEFSSNIEGVRRYVRETLYPPIEKSVFIASFSKININIKENDGILSMWRSYGNDGCYIEFDTRLIFEYFDESVSRNFDKVFYYGIDDRQQEYNLLAKIIANEIKNSLVHKIKPDVLVPFFKLATMLKHPGFFEEQEIRLAVLNSVLDSERSFEVKMNSLGRTYISLPFNPSAIKRIVVGPSKAQRYKMDKIERHLALNKEYEHVSVSCSTIPYRDWC